MTASGARPMRSTASSTYFRSRLMISWLPRLFLLRRHVAQAPHIRHASQKDFVLRKRRAGMETITHFSAEQLLELPPGLDHDRCPLLAEQIKPARGQARRRMAFRI